MKDVPAELNIWRRSKRFSQSKTSQPPITKQSSMANMFFLYIDTSEGLKKSILCTRASLLIRCLSNCMGTQHSLKSRILSLICLSAMHRRYVPEKAWATILYRENEGGAQNRCPRRAAEKKQHAAHWRVELVTTFEFRFAHFQTIRCFFQKNCAKGIDRK